MVVIISSTDQYIQSLPEERRLEIEKLPIDRCSLCGKEDRRVYDFGEIGLVCVRCEATDKDVWAYRAIAVKRQRKRKRNAMHNIAKRMKITTRVEFPNEGTCLLDGKFYYYAQKKKARVKGTTKYYQMRGFKHFVEVFGKPPEAKPAAIPCENPY